ncbi:hypothetical protein VTL71DRAFT_4195 [Oculimacula yallundae]|uniref:Uncharacterized protein n=1 Tax=Oculimacula yallundae TaxID=86028 RepID=A0ABR4C540_9HELO
MYLIIGVMREEAQLHNGEKILRQCCSDSSKTNTTIIKCLLTLRTSTPTPRPTPSDPHRKSESISSSFIRPPVSSNRPAGELKDADPSPIISSTIIPLRRTPAQHGSVGHFQPFQHNPINTSNKQQRPSFSLTSPEKLSSFSANQIAGSLRRWFPGFFLQARITTNPSRLSSRAAIANHIKCLRASLLAAHSLPPVAARTTLSRTPSLLVLLCPSDALDFALRCPALPQLDYTGKKKALLSHYNTSHHPDNLTLLPLLPPRTTRHRIAASRPPVIRVTL